jgi:hypothetical protein
MSDENEAPASSLNSAPDGIDGFGGLFDGIDPDYILAHLVILEPTNTLNGKKFWKTFTSWEKLTADQRSKVRSFWAVQLSNDAKARVVAKARFDQNQTSAQTKARAEITSKHDNARILYLRVDPGAAAD